MAGILFFQKNGAKEAKEADKRETACGVETAKYTRSAGGAETAGGDAWGKEECGVQRTGGRRNSEASEEKGGSGCGGAQTANGTGAADTASVPCGSLPASAIFMLSPDDILPNPAQPRKMFTEEAILRLADSIRLHGMIQPLAVRRVTSGGKYELVAGERRLRAAKYLRLEKVPCFTVDADSEESAHLAIIENIQRENLNMFEQAQAIAGLMKLHCLTQEKIAARLSCSQSYVANKLRLLRIPAQDREDILESSLTERHVRALLRLRDEQQRRGAMHTVIRRHMNVAATEEYIDRLVEADKNRRREESAGRAAKLIIKDVRLLYNTIDRAVETVRLSGVNVETVRRECLGTTEIVIRIPKEA